MEVKDLIRLTKYYLLKPLGYKDYVPFIVLSRSRTGSNFLNSSLRSHPNVRVKGEHFGHLGGDSIEKRYGDVFGKQPRYIKAAGCKVFYYHPHHGDATELFSLLQKNRNLRVIHLKREDTLRSVLSWMIARENDTYVANSNRALMSADKKRVSVDPNELIEWIEKTLYWERWGDEFFSEHQLLNISYEELTGDLNNTFQRVLEFLGLPESTPVTNLKRQNPEPVGDLISNWNEGREKLILAGYEKYIPE